MNVRKILETVEALLAVCICIALFLSACVFLIAFSIGWEDRLFGMRLDGPLAGFWLLAKTTGAVIILYFLAHYPAYRRRAIPAAFLYYAFLFTDAMVTLQGHSLGSDDYAFLIGILSGPTLILFVVHGTLAILWPGPGE